MQLSFHIYWLKPLRRSLER